jgi:hypothetical protein
MIELKLKCKICGKVALASDVKGLQRHLRLCHNEIVLKDFPKEMFFEATANDAVVEIHSETRKSYRKKKNKKWKDWKRGTGGTKSGKNPFVRIIYTPMTNG